MDVRTIHHYQKIRAKRWKQRLYILLLLFAVLLVFVPETPVIAQVSEAAQETTMLPADSHTALGLTDILWPLLLALGGFLFLTIKRSV